MRNQRENNLIKMSPKVKKQHSDTKSDMLKNPFTVPLDNDIFSLRDREKKEREEERKAQLKLKVHEKTTYSSRANIRKKAVADISINEDKTKKNEVGKDEFIPSSTKCLDHNLEKEQLNEFIAKKREMFLVQYTLGVKRDEIRKLEEVAKVEERKLELAEQYLEEDATMFDKFLKDNDKNAVEAIKLAEAETKAKMEKVVEIKKINGQMMAVKSEISKNEDLLKEYMIYKQFLEKFSSPNNEDSPLPEEHRKEKVDVFEDESSDEEAELYFTCPSQLLDILSELEEQNLSLIQNSQDTEEALDDMKKTIVQTKQKMEKETEALEQQTVALKETITKEKEKESELKMKSKMFSYGEFKAEDQEKMLAQLDKKVEGVYINCIGENEANISTLQMLTNIENRLEDLFEMIELMPPEKVEQAEKAKDKERRMRLREENILEQQKHQEERMKKAIERAQAEPKKKTGRRLVFRSCPPQTRKRQDVSSVKQNKDEEELKYFFT